MTDKVDDEVKDIMTDILHTMVFGTICGVVVDINKETGEKYYGLRVSKRDARIDPRKNQEYAIWFLRDFEDNGAGGFQVQRLS